jgi:hypothetical protein
MAAGPAANHENEKIIKYFYLFQCVVHTVTFIF